MLDGTAIGRTKEGSDKGLQDDLEEIGLTEIRARQETDKRG
jgi:hypothetical protein